MDWQHVSDSKRKSFIVIIFQSDMTNQWASYFASSTSNDVERWINERLEFQVFNIADKFL